MISPFHALQLGLGLAVWAAWFTGIYGLLSVVCAVAPPPAEQGPFTWINGVLLLSTFALVALLLFWARRCYRAAKSVTMIPGEEPDAYEQRTSDDRDSTGSQHWSAQEARARRFIAYVAAGVHAVAAVSTLGVGLTAIYLPSCL